jgi:cytidylate kinase
MSNKKLTIAIDGFSSCGKSTVAKELARKLGYVYVDTGAMYRAVTLYCMRNGLISDDGTVDEAGLKKVIDNISITFTHNELTSANTTWLNGEQVEDEIRRIEVSNKVSYVSRIDFVRSQMVKLQQDMGRQGGIVMDGRDIGTVVFPNADLKIFMTASPEVRAQRRFDELTAKGEKVTFDEILENVNQRDYLDQHREVSPLRQADDAHVVDNSHMTREEQFDVILKLVDEAKLSHR